MAKCYQIKYIKRSINYVHTHIYMCIYVKESWIIYKIILVIWLTDKARDVEGTWKLVKLFLD